jgi:hypothetical protein
MEVAGLAVSVIAAVIGATWSLRSALSKIESAIQGHVAEDKQIHELHGARILKLEKRRR